MYVTYLTVVQQHLDVVSSSENEHILGIAVSQDNELSALPSILHLDITHA